MNYTTSTQSSHWTKAVSDLPAVDNGREEVLRECVWFLHQLHPKLGHGQQRKAFVTASHYLHRFFSKVDVLIYPNPIFVAVACLFIAGKTEEIHWPSHVHGCLQERGFRAEQICEQVASLSQHELAKLEMEVLHVLDFDLVVHQTVPRPSPNSEEEWKETALLTCTRNCLTRTPEEMGRDLRQVQVRTDAQGVPVHCVRMESS